MTTETKDAPPPPEKPRAIDAILYREGWLPPGSDPFAARIDAVLDYAEPLLGGVKAEIRPCPGAGEGMNLVVPVIDGQRHHTLLYPEGHSLAKFPRYDWADQPNGCRHGTLKAGADSAGEAAPALTHERLGQGLGEWRVLRAKPAQARTPNEAARLARLDAVVAAAFPDEFKAGEGGDKDKGKSGGGDATGT